MPTWSNESKNSDSWSNASLSSSSWANEAITVDNFELLMESGDFLLQENADRILLESSAGSSISWDNLTITP